MTDDSGIRFEIYSQLHDKRILHCQGAGKAVLNEMLPLAENTVINIGSLLSEYSEKRNNQNKLVSDQCYDIFRSMGIEYGPGHQGLSELYVHDGKVLAKLVLPSFLLETRDEYVLHPCIMDSAFQSCIGTILDSDNVLGESNIKPLLPFALESVQILSRCKATMWADIQPCTETISNPNFSKLNIKLYDENGLLCINIKGFSLRQMKLPMKKENLTPDPTKLVPPSSEQLTLSSEYAFNLVRETIAKAIMAPVGKVKQDTPFEKLGIDSIMHYSTRFGSPFQAQALLPKQASGSRPSFGSSGSLAQFCTRPINNASSHACT